MRKSTIPYSIYYSTSLGSYRRIILIEGKYTARESGLPGGLEARRSIYYSTDQEIALYSACFLRLAEYPNVLERGDVMQAVVRRDL